MGETGADDGIIRNVRLIDQDAADDLTRELRSLSDACDQSASRHAQLIEQARHTQAAAEHVTRQLEQQMRQATRLLKSLQAQTALVQETGQSLDARAHEANNARARLDERFADVDRRIQAMLEEVERDVQRRGDAILDRAEAVARLAENAEVNTALLTFRTRRDGEPARCAGAPSAPAEAASRPPEPDGQTTHPSPRAAAGATGTSTSSPAVDAAPAPPEPPDGSDAPLERPAPAERARPTSASAASDGHRTDDLRHFQTKLLSEMPEELRGLIDGLIAMIDLLRATELDDRQHEYLRTASWCAGGLVNVMGAIRQLCQTDYHAVELNATTFDLRRAIEDAVEMLTSAAASKNVHLECRIDADVPAFVSGDPGRLRQILFYVLSRAVRLATEGRIGLHATVESQAGHAAIVRFTTRHEETELSWDRFRQALGLLADRNDRSAQNDTQSALGLVIIRRLVELMGGQTGAEHLPAGGFQISFTVALLKRCDDNADRRSHVRLRQEDLECDLGPVLDLSLGGMRIQCAKVPSGRFDVTIRGNSESVRLWAEVVWSRRVGFRQHETGIRFLDDSPGTAKALTRISHSHRLRCVMGREAQV